MIERKFVNQNMVEYKIKEFVSEQLKRAGLSDVKLQKTPLGEKIVVYASRPGLVVGRGGSNIAQLTKDLKKEFKLENPQVEIEEVASPNLDPNIIAEMIANSLERFGPARFKGIGYRAMNDVMNEGARGVEILVSGRVPSARARSWRFYAGYLKKCGETSISGVDAGFRLAVIKAGAVGVKVKIMPPGTKLPDDIEIYEADMGVEEITDEKKKAEIEKEVKEAEKKTAPKKEKASEKKEEPKKESKPKAEDKKEKESKKADEKPADSKKEEKDDDKKPSKESDSEEDKK